MRKRNYFLLAFLLCFIPMFEVSASNFSHLPTPPKTNWEDMWSIQLINNDNLISGDVSVEFRSFDGQQVDARAGEYYEKMCEAAALDGITLYLRSGYRNISTQNYLYHAGIDRYMSYGYSYATSVSIANKYYAKPAGSEHNIGLAFDIITPEYHRDVYTLNSKFAQTAAFQWLIQHGKDYGFILRYPDGRTADTGINYEPWHYRYVGVEHATFIMDNNLILEEYVAYYQETYPELYSDTPPQTQFFPEEDTSPKYTLDSSKITRIYQAIDTTFPSLIPPISIYWGTMTQFFE